MASKPQLNIYDALCKIFDDVHYDYRIQGFEVDIFIPRLKLAIEYDGQIFHISKTDKDIQKNRILQALGLQVVRIREDGLISIPGSFCIRSDSNHMYKLLIYMLANCELTKVEINRIMQFISMQDGLPQIDLDIKSNNKKRQQKSTWDLTDFINWVMQQMSNNTIMWALHRNGYQLVFPKSVIDQYSDYRRVSAPTVRSVAKSISGLCEYRKTRAIGGQNQERLLINIDKVEELYNIQMI